MMRLRGLTAFTVAVLLLLPLTLSACGKKADAEETEEIYTFASTDPLTVNVINDTGTKSVLLRCSFEIEITSKKVYNEMIKNSVKVNHCLINVLQQKKVSELNQMKSIVDELAAALNELFDTSSIDNIYFNEFLWS